LRLQAMGQERYRNGFKVRLQEDALTVPLHWKKPRMIFVNSMSDLFHKLVPTEYIVRVFAIMKQAAQHTFQVLTKRPERVRELASELPWSKNVWIGTSVETSEYYPRIHDIAHAPAVVRFLSLEPLLSPLPNLPLSDIEWVIVGGESGPGARPMSSDWVRDIRDQCLRCGVPFFFKQWGGVRKSATGRKLDGQTWDGLPVNGINNGEKRRALGIAM
jgi:protein gp37